MLKIDRDSFYFLPLAGSGEIGPNFNLYHYKGKWLIVDVGVTFAQDLGGNSVIMPVLQDVARLLDPKDIVGVILTHAHEDHCGAIAYLYDQLRCKVYATPFTAKVAELKLADLKIKGDLHYVSDDKEIILDPFVVRFLNITHSIPESNSIVIRTDMGSVLHTGDWKIDHHPLVGDVTDSKSFKSLGDKHGVLAMVCDSTNIFENGMTGSEQDVRDQLIELLNEYTEHDGMLIVTCFASNVARVESCALAAQTVGRKAFIMGSSMLRFCEIARECGYLSKKIKLYSEDSLAATARNKILLIVTGSQGESRSALARIANHQHKHVRVQPGDVVLFSARKIPNNEKQVMDMQNKLVLSGVKVITPKNYPKIHVSGHPSKGDLEWMYKTVKPKIVIPVHGTDLHIQEHVEFAKKMGIEQVIAPHNGYVIKLAPGAAQVVGKIPVNKQLLDGNRLIPLTGEIMKDRQSLYGSGAAFISIHIDNEISDIQISLLGVFENNQEISSCSREIEEIIEKEYTTVSANTNKNNNSRKADPKFIEHFYDNIKSALRRYLFSETGKKVTIKIHVIY